MGIVNTKIGQVQITLVSFLEEQTTPLGIVSFPVYAQGVNLIVKFMVIDCALAHNAILGRSWIHIMNDIPLTYQHTWFSTKRGIRDSKGDQKHQENVITSFNKETKTITITPGGLGIWK